MSKKIKKIKILNVVGARPNFMKVASLYRAYSKHKKTIKPILVHTGQHNNENMSGSFFRSLNISKPKYNLSPNHSTQNSFVSSVIGQIDRVLEKERPHLVIVVGDVNSTLAAALAANKASIPVAHIEAGLRSGDRSMPEEINRIVTDHISDFLFVTEKSGIKNLKKEGIPIHRIFFAGNTMIDTLINTLPKIRVSKILERFGLSPSKYAVITMHRPSNVDSKSGLVLIQRLIRAVISDIGMPVVFPVHPRTERDIVRYGLLNSYEKINDLILCKPLDYTDFMRLVKDSRFVLTDSGGIQEEAAYLKIPTITLRNSTERPSTVECGANHLHTLSDLRTFAKKLDAVVKMRNGTIKDIPLYDGKAGERIVNIIIKFLTRK